MPTSEQAPTGQAPTGQATTDPHSAEDATADHVSRPPMVKVALPNKGALAEEAAALMEEAGYRIGRSGKALRVIDRAESVEFLFLRPRDIAIYVGSGVIDLGITGRDLTTDSGAPVDEVLALGFGQAEFRLAAPVGSGFALTNGCRIATSYDGLLGRYLAERGRRSGGDPPGRRRRAGAQPGRGRCGRRRGAVRPHLGRGRPGGGR